MRALSSLLLGVCAWLHAVTASAELAGTPDTPAREARPSLLSALRPTLDLLSRVELGDQEGRDEAVAWTLRGRLGLEATLREQLKAFAGVEHTSAWHRDSYQAGSVHGRHDGKTVIADPESTELNQAWLAYADPALELKAGVQRIALENQRFVGNAGWRQNEQTFHAATFSYRHLVQGSYELRPALKWTGYSYLLDLENAGGANASSNTYGASLTGVKAFGSTSLGYRLEHARQADAGRSRLHYRARYAHAFASLQRGRLSGGLGYERLGAGSGVGFQTPLATLHAFNGYADKFS
jgi:hypothetical protein